MNLFYYYEKVFILMNTRIAGKDLMKHHCLIKKELYLQGTIFKRHH